MEEERQKNQSLATTMLFEATLKGDVHSLLNLLQEDPLILDRCTTERSRPFKSPLHLSAKLGHRDFAEKILDLSPSMCFARDQDGMTPVHVAAINGQIEVLKVFLQEKLEAAWECTMFGETILHLCVKNRQLEAVKSLKDLTDDAELLNSENSRGNTALHLAVSSKQTEMVEFLLKCAKIEKNCMNKKGMTAVDILMQRKQPDSDIYRTIMDSLKRAKAKPAKEVLHAKAESECLEEQRTSLMVVASLIATMAFQAGINPPGGVWQDAKGHVPGEAILSYDSTENLHNTYDDLLTSNTTALISSLCVMLFLISGLPSNRYILFLLRVTLWIAVTAIAFTYFVSVTALGHISYDIMSTTSDAYEYSFKIWVGFMGIIFLAHVVRFAVHKIGWQRRQTFINFCKRMLTKLQIKKLRNCQQQP